MSGLAGATRPVAIGGILTSPRIETKTLPSGREGLPVWFLPRIGVDVQNDPHELRLRHAGRELRYTATGGWNQPGLHLPELHGASLHVSLDVLRALGLRFLNDTPEALDLPAPAAIGGIITPEQPAPVPTPPPAATPPAAPPAGPATTPPPGVQLGSVRDSRTVRRALETQRVVLEFTGPVTYQVAQDKRGLSLTVAAASGAPTVQKLESGDTLTLTPGSGNLHVRLETGEGAENKIFTLDDPYRIVIDTTTNLDPSVTPPPDLDRLPSGVTYRRLGKLQLLSFDPAQFEPRVVAAPVGQASSVYDHVKRVGGIAGVNGGYFDPKSALPVDLVAMGGLMLAPSLERRAAIGFTDADVLFGFPRPRYFLSGPWGSLRVNTVSAKPNAAWVTLFVGDGRTAVGAAGLTTLILDGQTVVRAHAGPITAGAGEIAVTFDPARYPALPRSAGQPLQLALNWAAPGWEAVQQALAAGPLLVDNGRYALDPLREGFDTATSVWRPTRQVAFAILDGRPTIAYFDNGVPEEFARALVQAGATRALRLDSGSSATVYVAGGYFNTVWSRPVPNAIVFVPKTPIAKGK